MPGWLTMLLGMVAGIMLIAGAIYLAVRPYLRHDLMPGYRPLMPEANGRKSDTGGPTGEDLLFTQHHDGFL